MLTDAGQTAAMQAWHAAAPAAGAADAEDQSQVACRAVCLLLLACNRVEVNKQLLVCEMGPAGSLHEQLQGLPALAELQLTHSSSPAQPGCCALGTSRLPHAVRTAAPPAETACADPGAAESGLRSILEQTIPKQL